MNEQDVPVTDIFRRNYEAADPVVVNVGGAGSSKSYSIAQLFIQRFINENSKVFLITRKTLPALKMTAYKLVVDLLKQYGYYSVFKHNKTDRTIYYEAHNNLMMFTGLDDPEKIRSAEFNYIWMEEGTEFSYDDYMTLTLRLRAKTKESEPNRLYMSLNPSDEQGWIRQRLLNEDGICEIHSTYKDNPFRSKAYEQRLLELKDQDEDYYKIYTLGLWAVAKDLIYGPLTVIPVDEWPEPDEIIYGMDFGFNNPSSLCELWIKEKRVYIRELIYQTGLTNSQLIRLAEEKILESDRDRPIYADSAEPARIEEFYQAGFNIHPADKSVSDGIDYLKRYKRYTSPDSVNTQDNFKSYKWKKDKNGNVLDEPVKWNDHAPDLVRYGIFTHLGKGQGDMEILVV